MHILQRNLEALCLTIDGATKSDGTLNVTKAAEALEINQPTLLRMLRGEVERARPLNEKKITEYFRISAATLYSEDLAEKIINGHNETELEKAKKIFNNLTKSEQLQFLGELPPEIIDFLKN